MVHWAFLAGEIGTFVVVVVKSSSSSFYFSGQFIGHPVCHKGKAAG